ncbi:MAG TPA: hypothetical protein VFN88_03580 [Caulobacteraceae bacterium]|nr:hypothetical protein [Caulobacteraceae bacterium]
MSAARRRRRADPQPVAEAMLKDAIGRGMTSGQCARLRLAWKLERGSSADKDEAAAICRQIEAELRAGIDETVALERGRGGAVEEVNRGPIRMNDRDGLRALLNVEGGLTAAQYDAGIEFRAGWELRTGDLRSGMDQGGGGAHDNDRYVMARLTRAKKLTRTAIIERTVALECMTEPSALVMLRRVAGDGMPLSSQGSGRAFKRNLAALKMALDVADMVIRGL